MSTAVRFDVAEPITNYQPQFIKLGEASVTRFIVGGNPFSGIAHQTKERDLEMRDWYNAERVKDSYRMAEAAGVNTHLGRCDDFISGCLKSYWAEGGRIQWIAQTCPSCGGHDKGIELGHETGAVCCFLHGGVMDHEVFQGKTAHIADAIKRIKDFGMAAGVAGHRTETIRWAADHLDLDFFMACYYNPDDRRWQAARNYDVPEYYGAEHREAMCGLIQELPAPAIHYKIMAAGRNDPREAFEFVADAYRPGDAVCVGVFTKDKPDMIQEDINLLEAALEARGK